MVDFSKALQDTVGQIQDQVEQLVEQFQQDPEPAGGVPAPIKRKVLAVIYNPTVPAEKKKLREAMNWNDPDKLIAEHIKDLRECSFGYANFEVVQRIEVDRFPVKADGFAYTGDSFVQVARTGKGAHDPDWVDYQRIIRDFDIISRINNNAIDEVWLFAFPYAGFYESIMAGPGAFWCNAPELKGTDGAKRRFVIMGYNYQRGPGEMLENMGHRAESIMKHVFRRTRGTANLWERFTRYDKTHPGEAEVGILHYAPNSQKDYEWGNKTKVKTRAHLWRKFPNLEGQPEILDCSAWGNGDTRGHHQWWFKLVPHITGSANGISYNWWKYIIDPDTVR